MGAILVRSDKFFTQPGRMPSRSGTMTITNLILFTRGYMATYLLLTTISSSHSDSHSPSCLIAFHLGYQS